MQDAQRGSVRLYSTERASQQGARSAASRPTPVGGLQHRQAGQAQRVPRTSAERSERAMERAPASSARHQSGVYHIAKRGGRKGAPRTSAEQSDRAMERAPASSARHQSGFYHIAKRGGRKGAPRTTSASERKRTQSHWRGGVMDCVRRSCFTRSEQRSIPTYATAVSDAVRHEMRRKPHASRLNGG